MGMHNDSAAPVHPALLLDFEKIRFDRLPLHAVYGFRRALADKITPEQDERLREMIRTRRRAGERLLSRREIEVQHAERMGAKQAAKAERFAARRTRREG